MNPSKRTIAVQNVYEQLKEELKGVHPLLLGTPGSLSIKEVDNSGTKYVYRGYFVSGKKKEEYICNEKESEKLQDIAQRIDLAKSVSERVKELRELKFQVLDKETGNVLATLFNHGLIGPSEDTLTVLGTLAYCVLLNELGISTNASRTMDIDLGYHNRIKLGTGLSFTEILKKANDKFFEVPGMPSHQPSSSLKIAKADGIIVDVLTHGDSLGKIASADGLGWHAQQIPYLDYLIDNSIEAACLAGNHMVFCRVPRPEAFVLHKMYSSKHPNRSSGKKEKDRLQATTILKILLEDDPESFEEYVEKAPLKLKENYFKCSK